MTESTDHRMDRKQFAVIFGASSLVDRYLVKRPAVLYRRELQRGEPGADEHGHDAGFGSGARDPWDHVPAVSPRVFRTTETAANDPCLFDLVRYVHRGRVGRVELARQPKQVLAVAMATQVVAELGQLLAADPTI